MPKGKVWSVEENVHLATAWLNVSQDVGEAVVKGTNQSADEFWNRVYEKFVAMGPTKQDGIYGDRGLKAVTNQFKENISRDVKKFNNALLKTLSAQLSAVNEQEKINIAVAMHLGKTDTPAYRHHEFEAKDWRYYECWLLLKSHRAFLLPSPPTPESTVELDNEEEEESSSGEAGCQR
jgi:hypothetical protein